MLPDLRSFKNLPAAERFAEAYMPEPMSGCWIWIGSVKPAGYGQFTWNGRQGYAHRFSWELHNGAIPCGLYVLHICDNRPCVNPEHLFLGTHTDNMRDAAEKGRNKYPVYYGEESPRALLTEQQVLKIFVDGRTRVKIAQEYGVDRTTISAIKRGKNWGWLTQRGLQMMESE